MDRAERAISENLPVTCHLQSSLSLSSSGTVEELTIRLFDVVRKFLDSF